MSSRGVNKVILVGNLGQDPDTRYMPNGDAVTNISVATSEVWNDKNTGNQQERTEWHRVVFFKRQAEVIGEYLRKGSKIYVEGQLRTRKYKDRSTDEDRYITEVIGRDFQMLDSAGQGGGYSAPASQGGAASSGSQPRPSTPVPGYEDGTFDDDIPF